MIPIPFKGPGIRHWSFPHDITSSKQRLPYKKALRATCPSLDLYPNIGLMCCSSLQLKAETNGHIQYFNLNYKNKWKNYKNSDTTVIKITWCQILKKLMHTSWSGSVKVTDPHLPFYQPKFTKSAITTRGDFQDRKSVV